MYRSFWGLSVYKCEWKTQTQIECYNNHIYHTKTSTAAYNETFAPTAKIFCKETQKDIFWTNKQFSDLPEFMLDMCFVLAKRLSEWIWFVFKECVMWKNIVPHYYLSNLDFIIRWKATIKHLLLPVLGTIEKKTVLT